MKYLKTRLEIQGNKMFDQLQEWLHGGDIRPSVSHLPKGAVVMITDPYGVFLGCGKVSGDRVRNFNK